MPTTAFRLASDDQVQLVNDTMAKIAERYPDCNLKGQALIKLIELYIEGFVESVYRDIPPSVLETLKEVDCSYLKYEGEALGFVCYESFHLRKDVKAIASAHDKVIRKCNLCRLGKFDKEQSKIQEMLRKKNIKGLLELREILIKLTHESTLAQIYICKAKLLDEHELIISADGIHLKCPIQLDDKKRAMDMSVIEHCYEQVNAYDMNPPCKHLIDPHVRVRPPDRAEEILKELKQMEHQPTDETIQDEPIVVDAEIIESEVIEESETTDSKKGINEYQDDEEKQEDEEKKENEET